MNQHSPQIWLTGAVFETLNMGVSALAESSLKCIFARWPEAKVIVQSYTKQPPYPFLVKGQQLDLERIHFWSNTRSIFRANHIYKLMIYALLFRALPFQWFHEFLKNLNPIFKKVMATDLAVDITAGDSFSDLYGKRRLIDTGLPKLLFILCGKKLILLPQTYGPFKLTSSQKIAKYLLMHATAIYSRDLVHLDYVKQFLGPAAAQKTIKFVPDVAFVLEPEPIDFAILKRVQEAKAAGRILIGFNVSGLLYKSKSETTELFGLKIDYPELVRQTIKTLMAHSNTVIVLIPHVFADGEFRESDPRVCRLVYEESIQEYPDRILLPEEMLNHKQVKYLIGHCDFFLGARMHACIAAISQQIPALAMAYSGKFIGVFESAGVGKCVVDLRTTDEETILKQINTTFRNRHQMADKLRVTVPKVQAQVMEFLNEIQLP